MKRLIIISIICIINISAFLCYALSLDISDPEEIVSQGFQENKEVFEKMKEYYNNLEYRDIVRSSQKEVYVDNIGYYLQKNEDCYVLDLNFKYYDIFETLVIAGSNLEDISEGLYSIYVGISKETYELECIGISFSTSHWNTSIRYDKAEIPTGDFFISLGEKWYIYGHGYDKVIDEKEHIRQIVCMLYLLISALLIIYTIYSWLYYFIKYLVKRYKKQAEN